MSPIDQPRVALYAGPAAALAASHSRQARVSRLAAAILSGLGFFIIILSFQPFQAALLVSEAPEGGSLINQVGYLSLGLVYLLALLSLVGRDSLLRLLQPRWIIVLGIAALSASQAADPAAALRGVLLTGIALIVVASVLVLPRREQDFIAAGSTAMLAILAINYAVLLLMPDLAVHGTEGGEAWHVGFWRGHLSHKNLAAPVFSMIVLFGVYCMRSGARIRGLVITVLATIFVLNTGSKTTIGFLPLAVIVVFLGRATLRPGLTIGLHLAMTSAIALLTIGTIFSPLLFDLTNLVLEDPTFTGRDEIWRLGAAHIDERPWLGYGYFSFWTTPFVMELERDFEAVWDVRGIVSGHNSYMDALLTFGIPGGFAVIALLLVKPLFDYAASFRRHENRRLADFFMMIVVFMTYNGMLETFLLNRADPMWMQLAIAIFGLSLLPRQPSRS